MKPFVAISLLAVYILNLRTGKNKEFLDCARKEWSTMFANLTYIDDSLECLEKEHQWTAQVVKAAVWITSVGRYLAGQEIFYETTPDSVEKFLKLFDIAETILMDNEKIKRKVLDLDYVTKSCVHAQLAKATKRIEEALSCKNLLPDV